MTDGPILNIDVAHPPRHPEAVERELAEAFSLVRSSPSLRILKVIHGYGSGGKGGATKATVLNWAYRQRGRIRAIVAGEEYGLFDANTRKMREETGQVPDPDLDSANSGVTLLWIK